MIKLVSENITWHDPTDLPVKNCDVVIISRNEDRPDKMNIVMDVIYEDGYFNGKEYNMNDRVVCWTYMTAFNGVFKAFNNGGDLNEKDAAGCGSGVSEEVR